MTLFVRPFQLIARDCGRPAGMNVQISGTEVREYRSREAAAKGTGCMGQQPAKASVGVARALFEGLLVASAVTYSPGL